MLAICDLLALTTAIGVTVVLSGMLLPVPVSAPLPLLVAVSLAFAPFWLTIFTAYGLYDTDSRRLTVATFDDVRAIFHALVVGSLLLLVVAQLLTATKGWLLTAALFVLSALVLVPLGRGTVRSWLFPRMMSPRRVCVVGNTDEVELVRRKLDTHPEYGLEIVAVIDETSEESARDIAATIDRLEVDRVLLASSRSSHEEMLEFIRLVRRPDIQVSIVPRYFEMFASNAMLDELEGMPLVSLPPIRLTKSSRVLKRVVDLAASGFLLLLLSPLLIAVAIGIRLDSPGPVLFRQPRRGRDGSTFSIVKFRTMCVDAEKRRAEVLHLNEVDGPLFKAKAGDPRVTRIGRFLRRTSLDELPQLWNVVRGEMSLVGPRPFVVYEADQITGWGRRRLEMTPGVTGLWQVLGRNDIPFDEMLKLDYLYVTNWSLWWDLKILFQTIPVVVGRRGAY